MNADQFNSVTTTEVANATAALLDINQNWPSHVQVMASACLFALMVKHFGMNVSQTLSSAYRLMKFADRFRHQFRGVKSYMENEL